MGTCSSKQPENTTIDSGEPRPQSEPGLASQKSEGGILRSTVSQGSTISEKSAKERKTVQLCEVETSVVETSVCVDGEEAPRASRGSERYSSFSPGRRSIGRFRELSVTARPLTPEEKRARQERKERKQELKQALGSWASDKELRTRSVSRPTLRVATTLVRLTSSMGYQGVAEGSALSPQAAAAERERHTSAARPAEPSPPSPRRACIAAPRLLRSPVRLAT